MTITHFLYFLAGAGTLFFAYCIYHEISNCIHLNRLKRIADAKRYQENDTVR